MCMTNDKPVSRNLYEQTSLSRIMSCISCIFRESLELSCNLCLTHKWWLSTIRKVSWIQVIHPSIYLPTYQCIQASNVVRSTGRPRQQLPVSVIVVWPRSWAFGTFVSGRSYQCAACWRNEIRGPSKQRWGTWMSTPNRSFKTFTGWWFGCHFLFSHRLGMSSSQLTNIFQRGSNHQPVQ